MELSLPSTAISDISVYISGVFTDFWPLIAAIIGIVLGLFIIERVIQSISPKDFQPWEKKE